MANFDAPRENNESPDREPSLDQAEVRRFQRKMINFVTNEQGVPIRFGDHDEIAAELAGQPETQGIHDDTVIGRARLAEAEVAGTTVQLNGLVYDETITGILQAVRHPAPELSWLTVGSPSMDRPGSEVSLTALTYSDGTMSYYCTYHNLSPEEATAYQQVFAELGYDGDIMSSTDQQVDDLRQIEPDQLRRLNDFAREYLD